MNASILELLDQPGICIAVVGATDDPAKFGYRIYRDLKRKGFRIFPVNPNRSTVDGDPCFAHLQDLPHPPDIVNVVVPPDVTLPILRECQTLGLMNVWLQPGAEDPEVLDFLERQRFNYLAQTCIMVESAKKPARPR